MLQLLFSAFRGFLVLLPRLFLRRRFGSEALPLGGLVFATMLLTFLSATLGASVAWLYGPVFLLYAWHTLTAHAPLYWAPPVPGEGPLSRAFGGPGVWADRALRWALRGDRPPIPPSHRGDHWLPARPSVFVRDVVWEPLFLLGSGCVLTFFVSVLHGESFSVEDAGPGELMLMGLGMWMGGCWQIQLVVGLYEALQRRKADMASGRSTPSAPRATSVVRPAPPSAS